MSEDQERQLVPEGRFEEYQQRAEHNPLSMLTPLPPVAAAFYLGGGCWNLALAVHERTGLPIEVYYRDVLPRHAYVVEGDTALDAWGRRPLRFARAGTERSEAVTRYELLTRLRETPEGDRLVAEVERPELREAADRAAELLLEALGWKPGG